MEKAVAEMLRFNATWNNKFRLNVLCCIWLFFKYLINNRLIVSYLEEKRNLNQIYNRRPLPLKILVYPRNYSLTQHFLDSKILLDLDKRIFDSIHRNDGKKNHKYMWYFKNIMYLIITFANFNLQIIFSRTYKHKLAVYGAQKLVLM